MRKNLGESSKNVSYSKMAENSWSGQQATEEIVVTHEQGACRARSSCTGTAFETGVLIGGMLLSVEGGPIVEGFA